MEEGTIFQGAAAKQTESTKSSFASAAPPQTPQNTQQQSAPVGTPVSSNVPESKPMWQKQAPPPAPKKGFGMGMLLKAVGGLFAFLVIGFILFRFVLPLFTKQQVVKDVTITYWGLWETDSTVKSVLADFEKQNPHVKVTYEKINNKEYHDRLTARMQSGTGPDVFLFHNTWLSEMSPSLLPLPEDVMSKNDFQKTFYPVIVSDLTKNGGIYGVPFGFDTLSLFVNTEIFRKAGVFAPTNWQDFGTVARTVTVKDETGKIKTSGAAIGTFDNITHAPDILSVLFMQNGVNFNDMSNTSSMVDTLDFYTSFAKNEAKVWDVTLDPSILAFAKGNLAMYFGYSWDIFTIKAMSPDLAFSVVPVPHLPGRNMTAASYWVNGVSIKSNHQKEALLLIKFLAQKDMMQKLYTEETKTRLFGELYPRIDQADLLKDNSLIYPFVSQGADAASSFFAGDTYNSVFNDPLNGYLGNAVRAVLSGTSSQTAVETFTKGVAQVLGQYGQ